MVMMMAALLAGGGGYSWLEYRRALLLEQNARQLLNFFARVQADAYWRNETRRIWLKRHDGRWCAVTNDTRSDCPPDGVSAFSRSVQEVELAGGTGSNFAFYGLRNSAQPGHVTLTSAAGRIRLVLSVRGRLRLCSEARPVLGIPLC